jgi:MFS family permease
MDSTKAESENSVGEGDQTTALDVNIPGIEQEERKELTMDHGLVAWLQVLGSWILFWNTWGLTNAYGVFQTYYLNFLLPDYSASAISWIGSIQLFLTMVMGIPAGMLLDAGHLRGLIAAGTLLEVGGLFATAQCTQYWQIFLAQGICVGLGSGLLGLASVAVIPLYWKKRKMFATGIAATGGSLAGIIYPLMLRRLFVKVGFPWAVRALAFIILGCMLVCLSIMRLREIPKRQGPLFKLQILKDKPYTIFVIGFAFIMGSAYVPYFYIQDYALKLFISEDTSFNLLSVMNAASLVGRVASNYLGDKFGGVHVMLPSLFISAVILFFARFVHNLAGLVALSVLYGLVSGGIVVLPAPILASFATDSSDVGSRMGMAYTIAAFGGLVGNPIAGAAKTSGRGHSLEQVEKEFQGVWFVGAVGLMISLGLLLLMKALNGGVFKRGNG